MFLLTVKQVKCSASCEYCLGISCQEVLRQLYALALLKRWKASVRTCLAAESISKATLQKGIPHKPSIYVLSDRLVDHVKSFVLL